MLIGLEIAKPRWGSGGSTASSTSSHGSLNGTSAAAGGANGRGSGGGGFEERSLEEHVALWMREFDRQGTGHISEEMFHEGENGGLRVVFWRGGDGRWGSGFGGWVPRNLQDPWVGTKEVLHGSWRHASYNMPIVHRNAHTTCARQPLPPNPHRPIQTPGVARWVAYKLRALRDEPRFVKQRAKDPAAASAQLLAHVDKDHALPLLGGDL
jgi:hypothetical protein